MTHKNINALFDALDKAGRARDPKAAKAAAMAGHSVADLEEVRESVAPGCRVWMTLGLEITTRKAAAGDPAAVAKMAALKSGKPPSLADIRASLKRMKGGR